MPLAGVFFVLCSGTPPTDLRLPLFVFFAGVVAVPLVAEASTGSAAGSAVGSTAGAASEKGVSIDMFLSMIADSAFKAQESEVLHIPVSLPAAAVSGFASAVVSSFAVVTSSVFFSSETNTPSR